MILEKKVFLENAIVFNLKFFKFLKKCLSSFFQIKLFEFLQNFEPLKDLDLEKK